MGIPVASRLIRNLSCIEFEFADGSAFGSAGSTGVEPGLADSTAVELVNRQAYAMPRMGMFPIYFLVPKAPGACQSRGNSTAECL